MIKVLTCEQMKKADSHTINVLGVPSRTLMERAGEKIAKIADEVLNSLQNKNVLIVCGSGNNGGDGYVTARILSLKGYYVSVYSVFEPESADCKEVSKEYLGVVYNELNFTNEFGLIIDCIYGTGFHGELNKTAKDAVGFINSSGAFVISCDIPSGLNGDNGKYTDCVVCANITVAIGELKYGHILNDGRDVCGQIAVEDIGIALPEDNYAVIYGKEEFAPCFMPRKSNSHKGDYGRISVIGGSESYSGAPLMSISALKAGCGYLQICVPDCIFPYLIGKYPEVILKKMSSEKGVLKFDKHAIDDIIKASDSIAVGMGCTEDKEIYKIVSYLLKHFKGKLVLDADALNSLASYGVHALKGKKCEVIITPHIKEFSRLTKKSISEITDNAPALAADFAKKHGITVMLKNNTVIIANGNDIVVSVEGTAALAKGGSGDVLSGLVASISAINGDLSLNCACAMHVLGKSAQKLSEELSEYGVCASDIISEIPKTIKEIMSI